MVCRYRDLQSVGALLLTVALFDISGSYITVKSDIGQAGDQVTLWSPMETFRRGSLVTFKYHMWISSEDTTAALTVYTYSQMHVYERRLLEIRGDHGNSWKSASVCLPDGTYQLAFVATHGLQFLSDIALSNVELLNSDNEQCDLVYDSQKGKYSTKLLYNGGHIKLSVFA